MMPGLTRETEPSSRVLVLHKKRRQKSPAAGFNGSKGGKKQSLYQKTKAPGLLSAAADPIQQWDIGGLALVRHCFYEGMRGTARPVDGGSESWPCPLRGQGNRANWGDSTLRREKRMPPRRCALSPNRAQLLGDIPQGEPHENPNVLAESVCLG